LEEFAEVALPSYMEFVRALLAPDGGGESSKAFAFYVVEDVIECMGERSVAYWNFALNPALPGAVDQSAVVRRYAASTLGSAARASPKFAPMAGAAVSQLFGVLQRHGERHRRRRAVKADEKKVAVAVDAAIGALGQILERYEAQCGEHVGKAWSMWISNLPLKYDIETGHKTHAQLLSLASTRHPQVAAPEQQAKVLSVFLEIHKTKFSNSEIDAGIAAAVKSIPEEHIKHVSSNFNERIQRKLEKILKKSRNDDAI